MPKSKPKIEVPKIQQEIEELTEDVESIDENTSEETAEEISEDIEELQEEISDAIENSEDESEIQWLEELKTTLFQMQTTLTDRLEKLTEQVETIMDQTKKEMEKASEEIQEKITDPTNIQDQSTHEILPEAKSIIPTTMQEIQTDQSKETKMEVPPKSEEEKPVSSLVKNLGRQIRKI